MNRPTPEQIAKLPKWAQLYIAQLREDLRDAYADDAPPPRSLRHLDLDQAPSVGILSGERSTFTVSLKQSEVEHDR